jgi:predicted dehydrogenase
MQQIKTDKPTVYKDYEKMLSASDLDAILIATPPFEHPRMLEAAVEARKHNYCEKPMGVDLEAKRVIAAGRKADPKKCLSVGSSSATAGLSGSLQAHSRGADR